MEIFLGAQWLQTPCKKVEVVIPENDSEDGLIRERMNHLLETPVIESQRFPFSIVDSSPDEKLGMFNFYAAKDSVLSNQEQEFLSEFLKKLAQLIIRRKNEKKIRETESFDQITGLLNPRYFRKDLDRMLVQAKRDGKKVVTFFIDLDDFNLYGEYREGAFREIASYLNKRFRKTDNVGRGSGDSFLISIALDEKNDVVSCASQIGQELNESLKTIKGILSASIGISICSNGNMASRDAAELQVKNAKSAMDIAKEKGKDMYAFFDEKIQEKNERKNLLAIQLKEAIEKEELSLRFQPQGDLGNGKMVGAEVLVRWERPDESGEMMRVAYPDEFIKIAEDTGQIVPMGNWILREACLQVKRWQEARFPTFRLGVNFSPKQINEPDFVENVIKILNETGLDPQYLDIEVTEMATNHDQGALGEKLSKLQDLGAIVSIDDFGTGASSLERLIYFNFDKLKIDKSFVDDLASEDEAKKRKAEKIIEGTIAFADKVGMKVIAEGVEDHSQWISLVKRACHEVQGYYYDVPLTAEEFEKRLEAENFLREKRKKARIREIEKIFPQLLEVGGFHRLEPNLQEKLLQMRRDYEVRRDHEEEKEGISKKEEWKKQSAAIVSGMVPDERAAEV